MSRAAKVETELWIVFFALLGVVLFLAKDYFTIPDSWYPANWSASFASWVDGVFYAGPKILKPMTDQVQKPIDKGLAAIVQWFNDTFPDPSQRQIKQQFVDQGGAWSAGENADNYVPPGTGEVSSDAQTGSDQ